MTKDQALKSYIICNNTQEIAQTLSFLKGFGFTCDWEAKEYPTYTILGIKSNQYIFSVPNTKEHIASYCKNKMPVQFKDLFRKFELSPKIQQKIIDIFRSARAFNEDSGLNMSRLEEYKVELNLCYQMSELGILGNYNNVFFLKSNKVILDSEKDQNKKDKEEEIKETELIQEKQENVPVALPVAPIIPPQPPAFYKNDKIYSKPFVESKVINAPEMTKKVIMKEQPFDWGDVDWISIKKEYERKF